MEKSIGLSSQFVMALILVAAMGAGAVAKSEANPVKRQASNQARNQASNYVTSQTGHRAARQQNSLPETSVLLRHDDVLPTQNRTQAMVLESEKGQLPPEQEQALKEAGYGKQVNLDHRK